MGYRNQVSDSDIQSEKLRVEDPTVLIGIGSTVATTLAVGTRANKKRKRDDTITLTATTTERTPALNEISDDSDVSSDDEITPQGNHKQITHHKKRRKVVFADASSTTRYYSSPVAKEDLKKLKKNLWFTKQDRDKSKAECLEVLKKFCVQNAEEVMRFSDVYTTSMRPLSQESSDYLEKATVSVPLKIRGMEWGISPNLKKRRKEHIQSILSVQKQIRDPHLRARFVSSRSIQSSRPARIMARIIGEGDAGTTSTALNVTTVPLKEKQPLEEQKQNKTATGCRTETKKTTKLGHARRKRRAVLWRK